MSTPVDKLDQAIAWHNQGRLAEAEHVYREILQEQPDNPDALHLLGLVAMATGHYREAVNLIGRAIGRCGDSAMYYGNLGEALRHLARFDEARSAYSKAIEIDSRFAEAYNNLGTVFQHLGQYAEALEWFEKAVALKPQYVNAHYNRALAWLALGDLARGFAEYEWRWRREEFRRPTLLQPEWDGAPLAGRTLLVRSEQGLGDTLQFVRYLPVLAAQGAKVLFEAPRPLLPLLEQSGIGPLAAQGDPLGDFDLHASLLSLPKCLGTTLATIPAPAPYLHADESSVAQWRERLGALSGFRIGIAWQGNPRFPHDRWRSMPLGEFAPLARVPGARLVCLQKNAGLEQLAQLGGAFEVVDLRPAYDVEAGAFLNAAAIMRNLDLVITTDSALGHLAGALGVRTWLLLGTGADWRWLTLRDDSPWYPTVRLFRQQRHNEWSELMARVAGELAALVNSPRRPD